MAIERVEYRVSLGGHNIPDEVVARRFARSQDNLNDFKLLVDSWAVFDSSAWKPVLVEAFNDE